MKILYIVFIVFIIFLEGIYRKKHPNYQLKHSLFGKILLGFISFSASSLVAGLMVGIVFGELSSTASLVAYVVSFIVFFMIFYRFLGTRLTRIV